MLTEIVNEINESIKINVFKRDGLINSLIVGVCESIPRSNSQEDIIPVLFDNGKEIAIDLNDKYNLIAFHKIFNSTSEPLKNNFGDSNHTVLNRINASLIVWFNRKNVNLCKEDLALLISNNFLSKLPKEVKQNLKINDCYIEPLQVDYNGFALFQREYRTNQYNLKPSHAMFEIRYKIDLTVNKECLSKCSCI